VNGRSHRQHDLEPTSDREGLIELFLADRTAHAYGLADLEEPYWSASRWWRHGDAVVGAVGLPGLPDPVVYAISPVDPGGSLDLLAAVADQLPDRWVGTGPTGMAARLSATHHPLWSTPHQKMVLARTDGLAAVDPRVQPLDRTHLAELEALFALTHDASAYFSPDLLDGGDYVGIFTGAELSAVGGTHVASNMFSLVAVANVATHPEHRRRGLARAVVNALCHRLVERYEVVTLNVKVDNRAARALYHDLGFMDVYAYDEAELVRRQGLTRPDHT